MAPAPLGRCGKTMMRRGYCNDSDQPRLLLHECFWLASDPRGGSCLRCAGVCRPGHGELFLELSYRGQWFTGGSRNQQYHELDRRGQHGCRRRWSFHRRDDGRYVHHQQQYDRLGVERVRRRADPVRDCLCVPHIRRCALRRLRRVVPSGQRLCKRPLHLPKRKRRLHRHRTMRRYYRRRRELRRLRQRLPGPPRL